jgi:hypothetical protein
VRVTVAPASTIVVTRACWWFASHVPRGDATLHRDAREHRPVLVTRAVGRDHGARHPEREATEAVDAGVRFLDVRRHHVFVLLATVTGLEASVGGHTRVRDGSAGVTLRARGPLRSGRSGRSPPARQAPLVPRKRATALGTLPTRDDAQRSAFLLVAGVDHAVSTRDRSDRQPTRGDEDGHDGHDHCRRRPRDSSESAHEPGCPAGDRTSGAGGESTCLLCPTDDAMPLRPALAAGGCTAIRPTARRRAAASRHNGHCHSQATEQRAGPCGGAAPQ